MREIVFKMERPGLVEVGQEVDVSEAVPFYGASEEQKGHCEGHHPE